MSTALAQTNGEHKSVVNYGRRGVELGSLDDAWRFAKCVAESGLAPKGIETPAAVLVAIQMGAEIGLTPMASLQNIAVINGRPSVWGDAMLAVCRQSGVFDEAEFEERIEGEGDKQVATCTVRRKPDGKPVIRTFSVADAKKAGLYGKTGPWSQYPARMLQMRARSWALRDCFGDYLRGVNCAEEQIGIVEATVVGEKPRRSKKTAPIEDALGEKVDDPQRDAEPTEDEQKPQVCTESQFEEIQAHRSRLKWSAKQMDNFATTTVGCPVASIDFDKAMLLIDGLENVGADLLGEEK